jgi:hypothetical protein
VAGDNKAERKAAGDRRLSARGSHFLLKLIKPNSLIETILSPVDVVVKACLGHAERVSDVVD